MRVPLAMRLQSLWMMLSFFVSVHLLRLMWSFTVFPRRGKSSTVISGTKPFDCNNGDENSFGAVFSRQSRCGGLCFLLQLLQSQNAQSRVQVKIIWGVRHRLTFHKIINIFFIPKFCDWSIIILTAQIKICKVFCIQDISFFITINSCKPFYSKKYWI